MRLDYDDLAAEYARHRRPNPEVLKALAASGRVGAGTRVLEVGCGTGNYILALAAATRCAGSGVEPSAEMIARVRVRGGEGDTEFVEGAAESLPFPDDAFDLLFSVDVIHHVADRPAFFAGAARVLAPGGRLCTVTDSEAIIRGRRPQSVYFPESVPPELARYPPIATLRAEMAAAGFTGLDEQEAAFAYRLADATAYRDKAFSALHLISDDAFARGLSAMERDLAKGPIACESRYLMLWGAKPASGG